MPGPSRLEERKVPFCSRTGRRRVFSTVNKRIVSPCILADTETEGGRRELARRLLEIRREAAAWQPEKERPPEKAGEEEA